MLLLREQETHRILGIVSRLRITCAMRRRRGRTLPDHSDVKQGMNEPVADGSTERVRECISMAHAIPNIEAALICKKGSELKAPIRTESSLDRHIAKELIQNPQH